MRPIFQVEPEVVDPPPVSLGVPNVYDVDLDAHGEWGLSNIPPSMEINVC